MTSWDESQRHACGQQSLCQVTDLADASFVTNDLGVHFSLSLSYEAWEEQKKTTAGKVRRWRTTQVVSHITNHNTMSTKYAPTSPAHLPGVPFTCTKLSQIYSMSDKTEVRCGLCQRAWMSGCSLSSDRIFTESVNCAVGIFHSSSDKDLILFFWY